MILATGFAVALDGKIDMRTVGPTRQFALVNWLYVNADLRISSAWSPSMIEKAWEISRNKTPELDVIRVIVEGGVPAALEGEET